MVFAPPYFCQKTPAQTPSYAATLAEHLSTSFGNIVSSLSSFADTARDGGE